MLTVQPKNNFGKNIISNFVGCRFQIGYNTGAKYGKENIL
jgi:hypothetical protein